MFTSQMSVDLAVHIGNPHGQIEHLSFFIFSGDMLNAMAIAEVTVGHHGKIGDIEFDWTVEIVQKIFPILAIRAGADVLARRGHVEHKQGLVGHIDLHDRVKVFGSDAGLGPVPRCGGRVTRASRSLRQFRAISV